ncbi:MAG TPA: hypothetical protein VFK06_18070 [Candidatus Angelobacter sp.]|nr:hypothetical protein [Candidatus Angelobacter sp.]
MKRRDFLKQGGVAALGAPAAASLLAGSASNLAAQSCGKDLVVRFTGPFCFWWNTASDPSVKQSIKVMVPPVGPCYPPAPHQPWFGTNQNEKPITMEDLKNGINFSLELNYHAHSTTEHGILNPFVYEQQPGTGAPPLFNLTIPVPNTFIGVRRTKAQMMCAPGVSDEYCNQCLYYATGVTLVYKEVKFDSVVIKQGSNDFFKPCFDNDHLLPAADLGINMTSLQSPNHDHARAVWSQMLAMYPWMRTEITGIQFCDFDASSCDGSSASKTQVNREHPTVAFAGYGNDCQVPNMCLLPPLKNGTSGATKKKKY